MTTAFFIQLAMWAFCLSIVTTGYALISDNDWMLWWTLPVMLVSSGYIAIFIVLMAKSV